jgi:regulator of replication initiation timing
MSEENKKTATERLEILENTVNSIIQAVQPLANMAQDLMGLREAVKLLNNKLDAVVKSVNAGTALTDENLSQIMTENNAKELQDKVAKMVNDGLLASADTIGKESFVVINEQDSTGKVVNPRMQFLLSALQNEEIRSKLEGAKVGTNIPVGDKGGSLNVLEAYNIVVPQQAEASSESTPATEAAPTAEASAAPVASETATPAAETATA